ncbi:MAG TPA: hypothetical protein VNE63_22505 [Candidatus Acidoferrales bacterium]|nr:hypothetical protein [Candidatus Acidoferrales bacterium]
MSTPVDEIIALLRERLKPGFYGHVEVAIADGRIATVKLAETRKPSSLISNPQRMIEHGSTK